MIDDQQLARFFYFTIDYWRSRQHCQIHKKALTKQGGEAVILEIPSHSPEYYEVLAEARRKCNGLIFFYFSDDLELKEVK